MTGAALGAVFAGAASHFTDDPKKVTAAAALGQATEGVIGATAATVGARGSYSPQVENKPYSRYAGKQPIKSPTDPTKVGSPPVRDPIPTPDPVRPPPDEVAKDPARPAKLETQAEIDEQGAEPVSTKKPDPSKASDDTEDAAKKGETGAKTPARPAKASDPTVRPAAGLPTPEEDAIIQEYSRGLRDLRQRIAARGNAPRPQIPGTTRWSSGPGRPTSSADKALQAIEDQAVSRPDGKELVDALDPLTKERGKLKGPQGLLATQTGEQIKCEAVDKAPKISAASTL